MFLLSYVALLSTALPPVTDTIGVGHRAIRPSDLPISADTTEIFVTRNGTRQRIAEGVRISSRTAEGLLIVHVNQAGKGVSIDSVFLAAGTLAPVRHVEAAPNRQSNFTYAGDRLKGPLTDSTGKHDVDVDVRGRFDFSVIEQITNSLPYAVGYKAVILTYDVALLKARDVGFAVVGREIIAWKGRDVPTWKTVTDFGTHTVTRWTDERTRRDVRWEIIRGDMHMEGVTK